MIIGVVSDTHSREVPKQLLADFKKVDFIIHAGDFCSSEDYQQFTKLKDVKAVFGNMDDAKLRQQLPECEIFTFENVTIGIYHGHGPARGIIDAVKEKFSGKKLDVVVFGHSHQAFNETIGKTLFFNPGSPNDMITAPFCSYGLLEVSGSKVTGKIVKVK